MLTHAASTPSLAAQAPTAFCCPHCSSDQTQRASVIYSSGTSVVETKSTGVAVGLTKGGLVPVLGSSNTTGVLQTQLAQHVAPPARTSALKLVLFTPIVGVVLGLVLWFVAGLVLFATGSKANDVPGFVLVGTFLLVQVLGVLLAVKNYQWNRNEWPGLHAAWERQWFCFRCGQSFEPTAERAAA
jgi:hypothetical protein